MNQHKKQTIFRMLAGLEMIGLIAVSLKPVSAGYNTNAAKEIIHNVLHIPAYAVLVYLLIKSIPANRYAYATSFVIVFLFGIFNEYIQAFVPGRFVSFMDVMLNTAGIVLGIGFDRFISQRKLVQAQSQ